MIAPLDATRSEHTRSLVHIKITNYFVLMPTTLFTLAAYSASVYVWVECWKLTIPEQLVFFL